MIFSQRCDFWLSFKRLSHENIKGYEIDLLGAVHLLSSAWQQVRAAAIANCFAHIGFSRAASLTAAETDDFTYREELGQEVIKLTGNGAAESDATFFKDVLCEQDVPVTEEMMDTEIIQTAINGGGGGDGGNDKLPRDVPTSAEMRNLLRAAK